jgi:carbon starvation protein
MFLPAQGHEREQKRTVWRTTAAHPVTATLIGVAGAAGLAFSGSVWQIWPVFGASNQLLAALTLLVVTLVLVRRRVNFWVALAPMLFMSVITVWALFQLLNRQMTTGGSVLLVAAVVVLLVLALGLAATSVWSLRRPGAPVEDA